MDEDIIIRRIESFERTIATCLCVVPFLFATQCFFAAIASPIFEAMFADFGSKLPALTEFLFRSWRLWACVAAAVPVVSVVVARKGKPQTSVVLSTVLGVVMFILAQILMTALMLPVWQLGTVAAGTK